ncbi:MAG: nucleotide sugar dehydrogenase [Candidatus Aminicenantes bacterium]|nr:nucleotide sugar dehydrogenase [Candidatus Aminicenantes bacterium]
MASQTQTLIQKIQSRSAEIGVIGLGYVGLPLVLRFAEEKFSVTGFDIDKDKTNQLNSGKSYIKHIPDSQIKRLTQTNTFEATTDYSRIKDMDCILICVPTPLNDNKEPDLTYINKTSRQIAQHMRKHQLISLESTTYPGTTREILLPCFEENGFQVGEDFYLVYSPEREDPANKKYNTKNIPKVVGGITSSCNELGKALYQQIVDTVVPVSSTEVAELTKLLENIYRSVNIALVNELKVLSDKMGIDIWEVIQASSTKPFGFKSFYPGPGLGGHCIPIDPFYLSWKAREFDFNTRFIELAGEVNTSMPGYVISKLSDALNSKAKCIRGSKILVLGVAYKKDIDDIRESPAVEIIDRLKKKGAEVFFHDPYVSRIRNMRKYDLDFKASELSEATLKNMDAVLIVTDHSDYDYEWIVENSQVVVDTRNATHNVKSGQEKIVKA